MAVGPSYIYYASNAGICRCPQGGSTWTESQAGLCASLVPSLAVSPTSPNLVFAEVAGNGYFKSLDYGASWQRLDFAAKHAITKSWVSRTDANTIFILSGG
jgi:hypothetical protein